MKLNQSTCKEGIISVKHSISYSEKKLAISVCCTDLGNGKYAAVSTKWIWNRFN